jgi:NADH-quinone oxidoreductase subunit C
MLLARLGQSFPGAELDASFGCACLDVAPGDWTGTLVRLRDELGFDYFDWLSAVDELDEGFSVVAHVWDLAARERLLVRTRLARERPQLATATGVFRGAAWHERETHEMFGIDFPGHPALTPLLLPDGFEGNPLRKEFLLVARAVKPWPGAKEPGESEADVRAVAPGRRKTLPPGVPDPSWGPRPAAAPAPSGTGAGEGSGG